jgi:hypothetical protein
MTMRNCDISFGSVGSFVTWDVRDAGAVRWCVKEVACMGASHLLAVLQQYWKQVRTIVPEPGGAYSTEVESQKQ